MKASVVGDLHLFAKRSNGEVIFDSLSEVTKGSDIIIICGDLFDFRWSSFKTLEESFKSAAGRITSLLKNIDIPVVYILGNHDGIEGFQSYLNSLKEKFNNFKWYDDSYKLGDTLFIHGDIPLKSEGKSVRGRKFKSDEKIYSPFMSWGYTLFTRLKIISLYRGLFKKSSPLPLIHNAVELDSDYKEVKRVIFGHTHFALNSSVFKGREYHNCGTPMSGFNFNILNIDIKTD